MNALQKFFDDLKSRDYDTIRFATYRTCCKLRYLREKTTLSKVDIFSVIELFRSNGLIGVNNNQTLTLQQMKVVIRNLLWTLNKRLPLRNSNNFQNTVKLIYAFMAATYARDDIIRISSLKIALAILCSGKLMDRLRYIYTLISDSNGALIKDKFESFLIDVLALPTALGEGLTFSYKVGMLEQCLNDEQLRDGGDVNGFIGWITEPDPSSRLIWLSVLYKMNQTENVHHMIKCKTCEKQNFTGLRYKCLQCYNYQQCQDCYWRGRISAQHDLDHNVKEFAVWLSRGKSLTRSIRRSFRCFPTKSSPKLIESPSQHKNTLDLHCIVPTVPAPEVNETYGTDTSVNEEHALIARYASRLARHAENAPSTPNELTLNMKETVEKERLIGTLAERNMKLLTEVREWDDHSDIVNSQNASSTSLVSKSTVEELNLSKSGLEEKVSTLLSHRFQLLQELEETMSELKSLETPDENNRLSAASDEAKLRVSRLAEARKSIATILSQSVDVLNEESLYERDFFNELYIPHALEKSRENISADTDIVVKASTEAVANGNCKEDELSQGQIDKIGSANALYRQSEMNNSLKTDNDEVTKTISHSENVKNPVNGPTIVPTPYRSHNPLDDSDDDEDTINGVLTETYESAGLTTENGN
ncbi:Dystrobrevin beta [Trichoplax sp. H2]|nr:Dystrobrevin beta [Trichoplax sp. H2]|eukprot:RDD42431.1 Dystrobrevin beta [Trichoplax sp. H2]